MKKFKLFTLLAVSICVSEVSSQKATVMPVGHKYIVQSAINYGKNPGGCWDLPGYSPTIKNGDNIAVWELDGGSDQYYSIVKGDREGYYGLYPGNNSEKRVDIDNGKTDNGTNIKIWEYNGSTAQIFRFEHLGNGRFKIIDINEKAITLANRSSNNGSNVLLWDNHDGEWMEWYLIDANTKTAFIPRVETSPEFFKTNRELEYESSTLVSKSKGKAHVLTVDDKSILLNITGITHNSDVAPGQPVDKSFETNTTIMFENGNYIMNADEPIKAEFEMNNKAISFSGDGFVVTFSIPRQPAEIVTSILTKQEFKIQKYFENVSYNELQNDDQGSIAEAVSKTDAASQSTIIINILNGTLLNKNSNVRSHIYTELEKVSYKKLTFILKALLTDYFNKIKDPDQNLNSELNVIYQKMYNAN